MHIELWGYYIYVTIITTSPLIQERQNLMIFTFIEKTDNHQAYISFNSLKLLDKINLKNHLV